MPATDAEKKAMLKYREKRKKIACDVPIEKYDLIKAHAEQKGFQSLNAYVLDLIDNDMKK